MIGSCKQDSGGGQECFGGACAKRWLALAPLLHMGAQCDCRWSRMTCPRQRNEGSNIALCSGRDKGTSFFRFLKNATRMSSRLFRQYWVSRGGWRAVAGFAANQCVADAENPQFGRQSGFVAEKMATETGGSNVSPSDDEDDQELAQTNKKMYSKMKRYKHGRDEFLRRYTAAAKELEKEKAARKRDLETFMSSNENGIAAGLTGRQKKKGMSELRAALTADYFRIVVLTGFGRRRKMQR